MTNAEFGSLISGEKTYEEMMTMLEAELKCIEEAHYVLLEDLEKLTEKEFNAIREMKLAVADAEHIRKELEWKHWKEV